MVTNVQSGQKIFAAGRFWAYPTGAVPTVSQFGLVQDITIDFKRDIKRLYGMNQLPADIASATVQVTGKVTMGTIAARMFNNLMLGGTLSSTGQDPWIANETATIAGSSIGAGSVTVANGATFDTDLGVLYLGVPFVRVSTSSTPSTGQYNVQSTNGVYTFSSLQGNVATQISYLYRASGGQLVTMTNQPMGKIGEFQAVAAFLWGTEKATVHFNKCMSSDYGLASKLDDYTKPTFGFEAGCDDDEILGTMSYAELS